jgi:hypothetical protein
LTLIAKLGTIRPYTRSKAMRARSVSSKQLDEIMQAVQVVHPDIRNAEVVYFDNEYGLQEYLAEKEASNVSTKL